MATKIKRSVSIDAELLDQATDYALKNNSNISNVIENALWYLMNQAPTIIRGETVRFELKKSRKTAQS